MEQKNEKKMSWAMSVSDIREELRKIHERARTIFYELHENNFEKVMREVNYLPQEKHWGALNDFLKKAYQLKHYIQSNPESSLNPTSFISRLEEEITKRARIQKEIKSDNKEEELSLKARSQESTSENKTKIINKLKILWLGTKEQLAFFYRSYFPIPSNNDEDIEREAKKYFMIKGEDDTQEIIENEEKLHWLGTEGQIKYLITNLDNDNLLNLGEYMKSPWVFISIYFKNKFGESFKPSQFNKANKISKKNKHKVDKFFITLKEMAPKRTSRP